MQLVALGAFSYLFFKASWPYVEPFTAETLAVQARQPVELFLWLDPLVGLSTALAARCWDVALAGTLVILLIALLLPRCFCGYLCPLGTLIDAVDFLLHRRRIPRPPPTAPFWPHVRFGLLLVVLGASMGGFLLSGFVAAIPLLSRGLVFSAGNLQLALLKNPGMVPSFTPAVWFSLGLFGVVFLLSLKSPRFWCRYLCPTGALLSLPGWLRFSRRQLIREKCVDCGQCILACPFDAIHPDYTTRLEACSFCQTCHGACPAGAIQFQVGPSPAQKSMPIGPPPISRRAALASLATGLATAAAGRLNQSSAVPLRPPGSLPEEQFLDLCIRCEQCLKVCPGPVLQAAGLQYGWEALWTPVAVFQHAGCHPDCQFCTEVCPTGAIAPLTLPQKRRWLMGLAVVDASLCLPWRGQRECRLCVDECDAAGYRAIELRPLRLPVGTIPEGTFSPEEIEAMSTIQVPVVNAQACVGCGLCEYRCHAAFASRQKLLPHSAIRIIPPRSNRSPAS